MRDLFDKDPSREGITRQTVVFQDLVDMLMVDTRNSSGARVKMPSIAFHVSQLHMHLRNFHNTAESRHATLFCRKMDDLRLHYKELMQLMDLLERAVKDERLKVNKER